MRCSRILGYWLSSGLAVPGGPAVPGLGRRVLAQTGPPAGARLSHPHLPADELQEARRPAGQQVQPWHRGQRQRRPHGRQAAAGQGCAQARRARSHAEPALPSARQAGSCQAHADGCEDEQQGGHRSRSGDYRRAARCGGGGGKASRGRLRCFHGGVWLAAVFLKLAHTSDHLQAVARTRGGGAGRSGPEVALRSARWLWQPRHVLTAHGGESQRC